MWHQMFFCKLQTSCCFKSQPGHFFAPEQLCWTLDETHGTAFSRLAKALQPAILEKYRCCLFLCVAVIVMLLFSNNATICLSSRFYLRTIASVICMADFTVKMLQVILSSGVKPRFLKCDLRFSSALESSACFNLAFSVKPSIVILLKTV